MLFNAINGKGGVCVKATDVIIVCPAKQDDISPFPVADRENNVFVLNFGQRAILTQLSSQIPCYDRWSLTSKGCEHLIHRGEIGERTRTFTAIFVR